MYLHVRPLRRDESDLLDVVMAGMSARSRYLRFHSPVHELSPGMRRILLDVDDCMHVALVAETRDETPVGIARMNRVGASNKAELSVVVVDAWQRRGVGRRLANAIAARARIAGVQALTAQILPGNAAALALFASALPTHLTRYDEDGGVIVLSAAVAQSGSAVPDDMMSDLAG